MMKFNSMKNFGGAILGLLLFLGITLVSSTPAQAQYQYPNQDQYRREREAQRERQRQAQQSGWYDQYGNWHATGSSTGYYNNGYYNRGRTADNYGYYGGSSYMRQTALNAGYNAGLRAGRDDRRSGRYNPYNHGEYRSANKDYNSRNGDRYAYQQYFREAFINGYSDGFRSGY